MNTRPTINELTSAALANVGEYSAFRGIATWTPAHGDQFAIEVERMLDGSPVFHFYVGQRGYNRATFAKKLRMAA